MAAQRGRKICEKFDTKIRLCYSVLRPKLGMLEVWCSRLTRGPVKAESAGSSPVTSVRAFQNREAYVAFTVFGLRQP